MQTPLNVTQQNDDYALNELDALLNGINQDGRTIQEMKGIDNDQMEALYGIAYNYYSADKLDDAIRTFGMLTMLNQYESKYWKGLGASLQVLNEYEKAAEAYAVAAATAGIHDPTPHFHAGECYTHLKNYEDATMAFNLASELAENKPQYQWVVSKSNAILSTFSESIPKEAANA